MILDVAFKEYEAVVTKKDRLDLFNKWYYTAITQERTPEAQIFVGFIQLSEGKNQQAISIFNDAKSQIHDKDLKYVYLGLGIAHLQNAKSNWLDADADEYKNAKGYLNECVARDNKFIFAIYEQGNVFYHQGKMLTDRVLARIYFRNAIICYLQAIRLNQDFLHARNSLGNVFLKLRHYKWAEECFCITLKQDNKYPYAYNGLGSCYRKKMDFKQAIEYYEQALKFDNQLSYSLNYLGDCYRILGEYDQAKNYYKEALKIDDKSVFSLYGLGKVYYELGKVNNNSFYYKKALEKFDLAIDINKKFGYAYLDQGRVLVRMCELEEAMKKFEYAKNLFKDPYFIEKVEDYIDKTKNLLDIKSQKDKSCLDQVMYGTIFQKVELRSQQNKKRFQQFLKERLKNPLEDCLTFSVLRRWNSFTPIIGPESKGGGYFLNIYGIGIIIDPGFDIIKSFIHSGYKFFDIHAILVSHSHDDHTAQLESLINLLYKYNDNLENEVIPLESARYNNFALSTITDIMEGNFNSLSQEDLIKKRLNENYRDRQKYLNIWVPKVVRQKFCGLFKINNHCFDEYSKNVECNLLNEIKKKDEKKTDNCRIYTIENCCTNIDLLKGFPGGKNVKCKIQAIKAKHKDIFTSDHSFGFVFEFDELILVYTGDTGWNYEEIEHQYKQIRDTADIQNKKIILIAHLGGFKLDEHEYINKSSALYKNHLGRIGLVKINELLKPSLCIISEFGEEFKGLRVEIAEIYNSAFNNQTIFFPADINLKLDLGKIAINAIVSVDHTMKVVTYGNIPPEQVGFCELYEFDALVYFDKSKISANDCVQALLNRYKQSEI